MQTRWLGTALSTYSLRLLANRKLEGEERNKIGGERGGNKKTVRFISGHCISTSNVLVCISLSLLKKKCSLSWKHSSRHSQADSPEASGHVSFLYSNNPHTVGVLRVTPFCFTHSFTTGFSVLCVSAASHTAKTQAQFSVL